MARALAKGVGGSFDKLLTRSHFLTRRMSMYTPLGCSSETGVGITQNAPSWKRLLSPSFPVPRTPEVQTLFWPCLGMITGHYPGVMTPYLQLTVLATTTDLSATMASP